MRITGGKARGVRLLTPVGQTTRPAADALREALFSSLGSFVEGCRFADLFAGTGSYGLEAWSRGGLAGTYVEKNHGCIRLIKENIAKVAKSAGFDVGLNTVVKSDVLRWRNFQPGTFDLVFADPPYSNLASVESDLFRLVDEVLTESGLLVLEKPAEFEIQVDGWKLIKGLGKKKGTGPSIGIYSRSLAGEKI